MLNFFSKYQAHQKQRQDFLAFLAEAKSNLEMYYVMFQLGKLRFFVLDFFEIIKKNAECSWDQLVPEYARRLSEYNRVLKEYKDFEIWYNQDLDHKNKDNGRILHQKKELAQEQFQGLEKVIKDAVIAIEQQGIRQKLIKVNSVVND